MKRFTQSSRTEQEIVKAVLFTEFEDIEGYVVSASDPVGVMHDQFKDIGYHFLPDKGMCWKLISMALGDYRMIGVPIHIEDSKYGRRAYVFCFCLIVVNSAHAVKLGKIAAKELAELFFALERDHSYLSEKKNLPSITKVLENVRSCLNDEKPYLNIHVHDNSRVQILKPPKDHKANYPARCKIKPFFIPIALIDANLIGDSVSDNHDLIKILNQCNGLFSVSEISNSIEIHFDDLCFVLSALEQRGLIYLLDQPIDQFTRVRLVPNFHLFFDDLNNRQEAIMYSLLVPSSSSRTSETGSGTSTPKGVIDQQQSSFSNLGDYLVRMYCKLDGHVQDLGEFSAMNGVMNISIRQMVIFGLIRNFLRCKTMFPVFIDHASTSLPVLRSCSGESSWDEIGVQHGLTRDQLSTLFEQHNVLRIWK
jgi:hypothetical protein